MVSAYCSFIAEMSMLTLLSDEVIEFDFVKTEQQLYRELKRAALYINGTQPTGKRKSREEVEKTSRDIAYVYLHTQSCLSYSGNVQTYQGCRVQRCL